MSSKTDFEVLGLGLEASSPRKLACPRLEDSTIFWNVIILWSAWKIFWKTLFSGDRLKNFWEDLFFFGEHLRLCPWSLALASSISVLGLESVCPRKGCPWPWPRIFFVSLALASSLVSSTPPLLFTFKERQNKLHRSSVVYRITCSCKSTYIGQTSRNLITRLKNHGRTSPNRQDTDVSKRLSDNPDHKIDFDKTEITAQTNHCRKLLITETLLIQKHNPNLNVDRTSIPLYICLTHKWYE